MLFQNKSTFTVTFSSPLEEVKIHFQGCFDDSNFELNFNNTNGKEEITITSKSIGRYDFPILSSSVKVKLIEDPSIDKNSCSFSGFLIINYIDILATILFLVLYIFMILFYQEINGSSLFTLSIMAGLLIIYPIYKMIKIKQDKIRIFELLDDVSEACKISKS